MRYAILLLSVIGIGCPGNGGTFQQEFVDACMNSTNLPQVACECMAQKAENELSEDERDFVLAALEDDQAETERLRGRLSIDGALRAGMFMTQVSSCSLENP